MLHGLRIHKNVGQYDIAKNKLGLKRLSLNPALESCSFMTLGKLPVDVSQPCFLHLQVEANDTLCDRYEDPYLYVLLYVLN